ncbi:hypothetical protein CMK11_09765 [Candidatus Poribacteria bacterium]|nr:hypothetical protein [Candidatus Poribacteria bacterium]
MMVLTVGILVCASVPDWVHFPGQEWEKASPSEAGLDARRFEAWVAERDPAFRKAYGGQTPAHGGVVIARGGYILHTWGDAEFRYQSASLAKTFTRMALQLAIDDGRVSSADDLVATYWTGEATLEDHKVMNTGHNARVRFIDLQDMRGGFPVTNGFFWETGRDVPDWARSTGDPDYDNYAHVPPGTHRVYSSGGYWRLSQALTAIWGRDLKDLLDERIFGPIGIPAARWDWLTGENVRETRDFYPEMPNYGGYLDPPYHLDGHVVRGGGGWAVMSAADFARIGLLVATGGVWAGERLISGLGGNIGVAANRMEGWGLIEGTDAYFSFGKVTTGFDDPTPEEMASWVLGGVRMGED